MTITSHMLVDTSSKALDERRQVFDTHARLGLTDHCAARGCHDRYPCWYRRDAHRILIAAGRTPGNLL